MSEALQSFPHNAWQKSLSLGLIATIFLTSIPMPAFAATAETSFFYYHHGDHLGSTNVITEGNTSAIHSGLTFAKGDIVQRFEYSPYGQESYVLNPSLDLEVSYTGQTYDVESGLYLYNSRYYNPQLGRFIQPDTMIPDPTNLQAYNRYSYVSNNPIKYIDPTGHSFFTAASNFFFGSSTGGTSLAGQIMTVGSINYQEIPQSTHYEGPTDAQPKSPIGEVAIQYKEEALPLAEDGVPSEGFGEIFGVVEYSLDVADLLPVAGDIAAANLSLIPTPVPISGDHTYFAGVRFMLNVGIGGGLNAGLFINTNQTLGWYDKFGLFVMPEVGTGIDAGLSLELGHVRDALSNPSMNTNFGLGKALGAGYSAIFDMNSGHMLGWTISAGVGPVPITSSVSVADAALITPGTVGRIFYEAIAIKPAY